MKDDDKTGYLFEVDISIPEHLHHHFHQYPLFPENLIIKQNNLKDWQRVDDKESQTKKLILTFFDKKKYVVNYRYLKLALSLGYKITKFARVLQYSQSDFLAKHIDKNTILRQNSQNDFQKGYYKLMNNSIYRKTMENIRNRIDFKLYSNSDSVLKIKNIKRFTVFNQNLAGVHLNKQNIKLNKPICLGQIF